MALSEGNVTSLLRTASCIKNPEKSPGLASSQGLAILTYSTIYVGMQEAHPVLPPNNQWIGRAPLQWQPGG